MISQMKKMDSRREEENRSFIIIRIRDNLIMIKMMHRLVHEPQINIESTKTGKGISKKIMKSVRMFNK